MKHTCHARGCEVTVPRKMFMCRKHWFMLPINYRNEIWDAYIPGQENRMDPTDEYLTIAQAAVEYVAKLEGK